MHIEMTSRQFDMGLVMGQLNRKISKTQVSQGEQRRY